MPPYTSPYAPGPQRLNAAFQVADLIRQRGRADAEVAANTGMGVADLIGSAGGTVASLLERGKAREQEHAENVQIAQLLQSGKPIDVGAIVKRVGVDRARAIVQLAEMGQPKPAESFTLGEGQTRYGPNGEVIAAAAAKPEPPPKAPEGFTLGEGQRRYDANGQLVASGPDKPVAPEKPDTPNEVVLALRAANGDKLAAAALAKLRAFKAPQTSGSTEQEWVIRDGVVTPIPKGTARLGDQPAGRQNVGRNVIAGDAEDLANFDTSIDDLRVLRDTIAPLDPKTGQPLNSGATGNIAKLGAAAPNWWTNLTGLGTEAKEKQAVIDRVKQVIGKTLEGGVLRKEDELKYEKILPTIYDSSEVVRSKLDGLEAAISKRKERRLSSLSDAGYDVSKFQARGQEAPPKAVTDLLKSAAAGVHTLSDGTKWRKLPDGSIARVP